MFSDKELVEMFKQGTSKKALADMVFYKAKDEKTKISRYDALKTVEQCILDDYIKSQSAGKAVAR